MHSIRLVVPVSVVLAFFTTGVAQAAQTLGVHPRLVEVFTTTYFNVTSEGTVTWQPDYKETKLHIFELDAIHRIDVALSRDLTPDSEQSKSIVLQRIQLLDKTSRARMQHAAIGMAKTVQYGINRFPAIVFDGQAVVYGVTDLKAAIAHYQMWWTGVKP